MCKKYLTMHKNCNLIFIPRNSRNILLKSVSFYLAFSALTLLAGWQEAIQLAKNWVVGCWCGCLSGPRCRLAYGQLMPLPLTVSCFSKIKNGFTARCYASEVLAMALCPTIHPSVCLSVTSQSSTKTAKRRITQTTPHDSPGTQNRRLSTNNWLYLENGTR